MCWRGRGEAGGLNSISFTHTHTYSDYCISSVHKANCASSLRSCLCAFISSAPKWILRVCNRSVGQRGSKWHFHFSSSTLLWLWHLKMASHPQTTISQPTAHNSININRAIALSTVPHSAICISRAEAPVKIWLSDLERASRCKHKDKSDPKLNNPNGPFLPPTHWTETSTTQRPRGGNVN